jgi:mannose-6-phosphate isomerase-like protein (cupin superfamily)
MKALGAKRPPAWPRTAGNVTMSDYRIRFDEVPWDSPMDGVRHKIIDRRGVRLRLVEYGDGMEPHWCDRGHVGHIIEGRIEIEFESETLIYETGDGVFIPSGDKHKHKARVIDGPVLALFVEQV